MRVGVGERADERPQPDESISQSKRRLPRGRPTAGSRVVEPIPMAPRTRLL
jgi:hypothetical protein